MIQIPLQAVPTQSLSIQLNDQSYDILLRACNVADAQIMTMDLTMNNEVVLIGQRLVAGVPSIPYQYLTQDIGNFILLTTDGDLPDYTKFQVSQYLIYATQEEIDASS